MGLSSDLISQFVKITNDSVEAVEETTVYGTIVEYEGTNYVRLDGSELLTPITATANVKPGERVTVMIKNHTATVTGNLSSPSARIADIEDSTELANKVSEFEIVLAQKVDTEDFVAEQARIDTLVAKDVEITGSLEAAEADIDILQANHLTVTERLEAVEADIENLVVNNLDVSVLDAKYAKITDLEATNADVYNLESTYANFESTTTTKLTAVDASIEDLQTNKLSAEDASITYAKITDLDATNADVANLEADVADIDTLIFGSASGTTIQTSFANAVIAQLGNAQIKSAMIESIAADKITSGDIITNNVRVMSEDGLLLISDETIQISDENRVRVQIGKDSSNDYSINIWDADGNLMFSKGGITDSAIKNAIIRNDMISDSANIAAHKLDIDSLFEQMNGSTNTLKSTKIYLDDEGQTLDVAFKTLETDISDLDETVSSQGTQITAIQGQISSKIWQEDIETAVNDVVVGGRNLLGFHNGTLMKPLVNTVSATLDEDTYGATVEILETGSGTVLRLSNLGFDVLDLGNEPFTFSAIAYASVDECPIYIDICDEASELFTLTTEPQKITYTAYPDRYCTSESYNGFVDITPKSDMAVGDKLYFEKMKVERGTVATDFTVAPEDLEYVTDELESKTTVLSTQYSSLEQTVNGLTSTVASHTTELESKADTEEVTAVSDKVTTLEQTVESFKTTVSSTYATKDDVDDIGEQVTINTTAIEQNATAIESRVTQTELSDAVNSIDVGGKNLLLDTANGVIYPETEDFTSYSKGASYKFAPSVADDVKGFLLGLKNGECFTLSFDVDIPRAYKDESQSLSRVGAYIPFIFTHTDGTTTYWYGTHSTGAQKTNKHTIETIDTNSLVSLTTTETSYVGRYACCLAPATINLTILKAFYADPDSYTVTCAGVTVEFRGYTTGGSITKLKLELGNKSTDWTTAPEDLETRVETAESSIVQNAESITSLVSRTTANESSITQLSNSITSNVTETSNLETRMSTVEQTAEGLTARLDGVEDDVTDAAKTATNYLNYSGSGLVVGDHTGSSLGKNVCIDSDSVDIRNNTTVLASFGANEVILGQNDENSVINLCDGAGKISANTSEAATAFPYRNAILIESQEIETASQRFVTDVTNSYGVTDTPDIQNDAEIYMLSNSSTAGSFARMAAQCTTTSSGDYMRAGVSSVVYDEYSTTHTQIYALDSTDTLNRSNRIDVYPHKTIASKPIYIDGVEFCGSNKVLWSGAYYMMDSQSATLSEAISSQANGIVLVWSEYTDGEAVNANFNMFYIPKYFVSAHAGRGVNMIMSSATFNVAATKYVYVTNTTVNGYANNSADEATKTCGITTTPKKFVLRYIIGV